MLAIVLWILVAFVVFAIAAVAVGTRRSWPSRAAQEPLRPRGGGRGRRRTPAPGGRRHGLLRDDAAVLVACLEFLERRGLASQSVPAVLLDRRGGPVVVADDDTVGYVLGWLADDGQDVDDTDVVWIVREAMAYLRLIGALGTTSMARRPDPGRTGGDRTD
ncbi:MAG: hypothetical protein U5R31_02690 [Acidimicrobiia bacterium]|nr:hypothetical protein [Acidimicrobiia bacterium]